MRVVDQHRELLPHLDRLQTSRHTLEGSHTLCDRAILHAHFTGSRDGSEAVVYVEGSPERRGEPSVPQGEGDT